MIYFQVKKVKNSFSLLWGSSFFSISCPSSQPVLLNFRSVSSPPWRQCGIDHCSTTAVTAISSNLKTHSFHSHPNTGLSERHRAWPGLPVRPNTLFSRGLSSGSKFHPGKWTLSLRFISCIQWCDTDTALQMKCQLKYSCILKPWPKLGARLGWLQTFTSKATDYFCPLAFKGKI